MINLILYSSLVRTKLYGFRVLQTAAHIYDGKLYSRDEVFVMRICTRRREAVACRCQGRSQQIISDVKKSESVENGESFICDYYGRVVSIKHKT